MKTFTLEEAQTLVPVLESLVARAIAAKEQADVGAEAMATLARKIQLSGGMLVDVRKAAHGQAARLHALQQASDAIDEIDAIGVQVKDLSTGLLDFPFKLEGEIVLLCWKLGETEIGFWHSTEDGFRGRQPLDERFAQKKKPSPRNSRPN